MTNIKTFVKISVATAALFAVSSASATLMLYSDRGTWLAALGSPVMTEDLNSVVADVTFTNGSIGVGDLTIASSGGAAGLISIDVPPGVFGSGTGIDGTAFLNGAGLTQNSLLTITLPDVATAFGVDTLNYDFGDEQAELFINGASIGLTPFKTCGLACNETGFVGVIASPDMAFSNIEIRIAAGTGAVGAGFDNISYNAAGPVAAVPEPTTLALIGLGLAGLGYRKRK